MTTNDLVPMCCALTREQHTRLAELSRRTRVSMGAYIRQALADFLLRQKIQEAVK